MNVVARPVPGYADLYAGMDGSITHGTKGQLEQKVGPKGYWYVSIPGGQGTVESHRLVAAAFLGRRPKGIVTRHGEGGKLDNSIGNLCYGTHQDNMQDAIDAGRGCAVFHASKTECPQGHEYTPENTYVYESKRGYTKRHCRTCRADKIRQRDELRRQRRLAKGN